MLRQTEQLHLFVGDQTLKEAIDTEICSKGHPGRPMIVALTCCWLALYPQKKSLHTPFPFIFNTADSVLFISMTAQCQASFLPDSVH